MLQFKRVLNADVSDTRLLDEVHAPIQVIEYLFGRPSDGDGHKTTLQWEIVTSDDDILTIYDWKRTGLYDDSLPSVESLRHDTSSVAWNVGGSDSQSAVELVRFIEDEADKLSIAPCYSCKKPYARFDWATPSKCPHCRYSFVD